MLQCGHAVIVSRLSPQGIVREYGEEAEEGNLLEQLGLEKLLYLLMHGVDSS